MTTTCTKCGGTGRIERKVPRTWWQVFLNRPTTIYESCKACGGMGEQPVEPNRVTTNVAKAVANTVQVPNRDHFGDGKPLILSASPNLDRIFTDLEPESPLSEGDKNRSYWQGQDLAAKRNILAIAFLQHPNAAVRLATISLVQNMRTVGVSDELINLLGDSDASVSRAAAASIWERQKDESCSWALKALRDEIRGSTSMGATDGLVMGRQKAIRALDVLIESAPNEGVLASIKDMADREIVIEERIKQVDTSSVKFAKTEQRRQFTYEIYNAPNREQALAFLKSRSVSKPMYYLEVETPQGKFGRDLNGIYW
jgi:hypothetical protein